MAMHSRWVTKGKWLLKHCLCLRVFSALVVFETASCSLQMCSLAIGAASSIPIQSLGTFRKLPSNKPTTCTKAMPMPHLEDNMPLKARFSAARALKAARSLAIPKEEPYQLACCLISRPSGTFISLPACQPAWAVYY